MKVLVGMSGGVDSTLCAILLKKEGHDVVGATMSIWNDKNKFTKLKNKSGCLDPNEIEDIKEAKKAALKLNIPHYCFDLKDVYEDVVLKNLKEQYLIGKTPNPCVLCNSEIKFKALLEVSKNNGIKFDKFATGHYAKIAEFDGEYHLMRGLCKQKDQSYFLYRLDKNILKDLIFPLGNFSKDEVRKMVELEGFDVAYKKDSQDFYAGDLSELLNIEDKIGNIVDADGKKLGEHKGIWNYTLGQRKGLNISANEPYYVIALKKETNEVVVGEIDKTYKKSILISNIKLLENYEFEKGVKIQAKIRSTGEPALAYAKTIDENKMLVTFDEYQKSPSLGQSLVLYDNDLVLGGGIILDCN